MRWKRLFAALLLLVATPASHADGLLSIVAGSEARRWEEFQVKWSDFLNQSLAAGEERRRLVAAQLILARADERSGQERQPRHAPSDVDRAKAVRSAVRAGSHDAVTLTIAAGHCRPPSDECDRSALAKRAAAADPDNGWLWLQLGGHYGAAEHDRSERAFMRALSAPRFDDVGFSETIASLYVPVRRERPDIDPDLALMELMGLAAAGITPAPQFVSSMCRQSELARADRADTCRRLAWSMAHHARTALTLRIAQAIGQRVGVDGSLMEQWKARERTVGEARRTLPPVPTQRAKERAARWGDDLVTVGELEAAARLLERP